MADKTRTESQLIALYPDNSAGLITAQAGRDFITSTFPYQSATDPDNNCDNVNTAMVPDATGFDTGSWWYNTVTGYLWRCKDGTPTAAVWYQVIDTGVPMAGDLEGFLPNVRVKPMLGKLGLGPVENANCKITLVAGIATNASDEITTILPADMVNLEPGMTVYATSGFPSPTRIIAVDFVHNKIQVSDPSTGSGPIAFDAYPLHYEWVQQTPGTTTSAPSPKPGGIVGTLATGPARNTMPVPVQGQGQDCLVWFRGIASGIPIYEFELLAGGSGGGGGGGSVSFTAPITVPAVQTTPAASDPTTSNTWYVSFTTNYLTFNNASALALLVVTSPDAAGMSPNQVMVTDSTGLATTIGAMGDGQLVIGAGGGPPAIGSLASSDSSITITPGPGTIDLKVAGGGGGGNLSWTKFTLNWPAVTSSSNFVATLGTFPAGTIVHAVVYQLTQLWTFGFSGTTYINTGYSGGSLPNVANPALFGGDQVWAPGGSRPVEAYRGGPNLAPFCPNTAATWNFDFQATGFNGAATAGQLVIWVLTSNPP